MKKIMLIICFTMLLMACSHEVTRNEPPTTNDEKTRVVEQEKENLVPMEEIQKKLLEEEWVKQNVSMKMNCFSEPIMHEQQLTFEKIADDLVLVQALVYDGETDFGVQVFLVGFQKGAVQVISYPKEIPAHPGHEAFLLDTERKILCSEWEHQGELLSTSYRLSNLKIERIQEENVTGDAAFHAITTSLTPENIQLLYE